MEALRYVLNAREDFDRIRSALARDSPASDVQRAAWFYQLIRYSYASGLTSFGSQPHDMRSNFSLIEQAHRRLAKVVIENKDFEKLLHQYDRPVSFFYLDPPYHATEGYYQNIGEDGFTEADHIRLRDALMRIEGKFLLSYNDDAFVRGLYDRPGIYLMETTRINNIKQRYLREEAGIPAGAKLCVYVDDEEKTVTIAEAGYDHDLRDVPPYLLEMLGEAGICLGELEEQLMVGNLIYGERTACNGQEEHGDE